MRNFKVIAVALVLVLGVACKKKKTEDSTGNTMGSGPGTAGTTAGSGTGASTAGSNDMAGSGSATPEPEAPKKPLVNMAFAEMKWQPMDPSDKKAPDMVPLWGDMMKGPNGFIIRAKGAGKGSKDLPHTHSTGQYGVTISGAPNHMQEGDKKPVPLPTGSFWFQPGGSPHVSQCLGKEDCVAFVYFTDGPADFEPAELDKKGKRDPKYIELTPKDIKWTPLIPDMKEKSPMIADVAGDSASGAHHRFWKFPAGFASPAHTHTADYHGVVISGTLMNHTPDDKAPKEMGPGSYWMQPGGVSHITACKAGAECIAYSYTLGKFDFATDEAAAAGGGGGSAAGSAAGGDMKGSDAKK